MKRFEYHLDFPGNALDPGCDYNRWAQRLTQGSEPVVYAHVVGEAGSPGKLALQYWFFYPFNDFNNTHEGDWEMIQLVFDAPDARAALGVEPVEVGYSSHEGAERAAWDDEKLELVGRRPVVYPAAGSHANKYSDALWLGSSAEAGVGCDDTRGPHRELSPRVVTIPSDREAARPRFPGSPSRGAGASSRRRSSTARPARTRRRSGRSRSRGPRTGAIGATPCRRAGRFGTGTTDFFCSAVAKGSRALAQLLSNPLPLVVVVAAVLGLVIFAIVRATWTPVAPLRIARRRSWGQIISASARMYVKRPVLFLGLGVLLVPIAVAMTFVQWLLLGATRPLGSVSGEAAGAWAFLAVIVGTTFALLGLGLVMAAAACALVEIDADRPGVGLDAPIGSRCGAIRPLLGAIALFVVVWVVLTSTVFLIPVAIWLAIRWCLVAPVVELEERRPFAVAPTERRARPSAAGSASARSSGSARLSRSSPALSSARS